MKSWLVAAVALAGGVAYAGPARAEGPPQVSAEVHHDALVSLRDTRPQPDGYARWHARDEHMIPLPFIPPGQRDGAVQRVAARAPAAAAIQSGVDGVGAGFSGPNGAFTVQYAPPDTVGAVGATQYLQIVNSGLAIFDKATKSVVYGPVPTNILWSGFGGACEADNDGDAVVVYDRAADRWIVSQFAVANKPYYQCVAVSQSSDATAGWYRYAFTYGVNFPDYPKMGVWPDAYYETFNMYKGNAFLGALLCAYNRAAMLGGAAATQQCFQLDKIYGGVLPSDLDGATAPPAGSPNYLVNFGTNSLNLWKFHVDWANTANSTLTGPASIAVAAFTPACGGGVCVPQSGVNQQLDSLADRMMFRLAYRNFGAYESLVVNHTVTVGTDADPYSGVRWYEIRSPGTVPDVHQQSTYAPDANYRWMGSVAMDRLGNLALGYSVSGSTLFPAIRYAGRLVDDTSGTLQAETSIIEGTGAQSGQNLDRWGDYSAMSVDPVDDCTFWYTNEYLKTTGAFNWSTRIASFSFPVCNDSKLDQTVGFTSDAPAAAVYNGSTYTATAAATSGLAPKLSIDAAAAAVCQLDGSASGAHVAFTGVGTCTIDANQAGSPDYKPAPQAQQAFAVGQAAQAITFDSTAPASAGVGGTPYQVLASATSALPVTLTIDAAAASVCQIDGSASGSHVSFIGLGSCIIDAAQAGNANYTAAPPQQQSFNVGPGAPAQLVFSMQPPGAILAGDALGTVAVTEKDAFDNVIDDDASSVDFSVPACAGNVDLGSATTSHGVATLVATQRFYVASASRHVVAKTGALTGSSATFTVTANSDVLFAGSFEACQL